MGNNEWISNLKVGDSVIVYGRFREAIRKVTAINKATIKVGDSLFNKDSGMERGGDTWNRLHIMEATPERVASVRRNIAQDKLWRKLEKLSFALKESDKCKLPMESINELNATLEKIFVPLLGDDAKESL